MPVLGYHFNVTPATYALHNLGEGLAVAIGGGIFLTIEIALIVIENLLRLFGL